MTRHYLTSAELVAKNPKSYKSAIMANCLECEQGTRADVHACTTVSCYFFHLRPWRNKEDDIAMLTRLINGKNVAIKPKALLQLKFIQTGEF